MSGHLAPTARNYAEALPMPSSYFSLILREHGASGRDQATLLTGTGLSEATLSATPEISLGQQLRQIRNVAQMRGPTWSLATGSRLHPSTHGPIGLAAVSAPSLRDALKVMERFSQVRSPHFRLRVRMGASEVRIVPEDLVALTSEEQGPLIDIVLLSTQGLIEAILGRPLQGARFELPYRPGDDVGRYAEYFHAPLRFACPEPAIVFPSSWLAVRSPLADPAPFRAAVRALGMRERALYGDRVLVARVERLLARRGARLQVQSAATLLGVSTRTLTRKLANEGTSFHTLREASLKATALAMLSDRELSIAEVAYAIGYEDAANFGRAFRRWFGVSP
ncbi:MAG: AraC family transcriptional regulator ligand-binding domain-containing protein, partial [Myxococcales bacterium]|nr:AraC family transcriptional regulator ligand-binding domain-containing protein [Myxococcales bacterium]